MQIWVGFRILRSWQRSSANYWWTQIQSPLGELFERSHILGKGTKMIENIAAIGDLLVAEGTVLLKPQRGLMTEAPWDECSNTLIMYSPKYSFIYLSQIVTNYHLRKSVQIVSHKPKIELKAACP